MASKFILDSNVWIAFFNTKDSTHNRAVKLFQELDLKDIVLTEYIVLEVTSVLKKNEGLSVANMFLENITKNLMIVVQDNNLMNETIKIFSQSTRSNLSFVDCSLIYLSQDYIIKTFDKTLANKLK